MILSAAAQWWVNIVLVWVGFGAVVALLVSMLLPGNNPKSFLGYLTIGVCGTCIGPIAFTSFASPERFHPLSPAGFGLAVSAAAVLLLFYRFVVYLTAAKQDPKPSQPLSAQQPNA